MGKYSSFIKMKGSTYDTTFYYQKGVGNIFKEKTSFRLKEKWNSLDPVVREKFAASQKNATNFDAIQKGIKYWKAYLQNLTKYGTKQTHKQLFDFIKSMQAVSSDDYHKDIVFLSEKYPQTLGLPTISDILPIGASINVVEMQVNSVSNGVNFEGIIRFEGAESLTLKDLNIDWQKYDTISFAFSPVVPQNILWAEGQFNVNYSAYFGFSAKTYQCGNGDMKLNKVLAFGSISGADQDETPEIMFIPGATASQTSVGGYLTIVASNSTDNTIAKKQYTQKLDYQFTIG